VAQLVVEAARRLDLPPPPAPTNYANATLSEIATALETAARTEGADSSDAEAQPTGIDEWVGEFSIEYIERPLLRRDELNTLPRQRESLLEADWRVLSPADHPLKIAVQRSFAHAGAGRGIVILLPPEPGENHLELLLDSAREALNGGDDFRFVLVQHAGSAAS